MKKNTSANIMVVHMKYDNARHIIKHVINVETKTTIQHSI